MDLIAILQSRIDALPEGNYTPGLKAVFQHVEVATRHLARGKSTADNTAFTDAVYRTNQAFEGSLKEAELTSEDIKACLAFAADREKKLFVASL